MKFSSCLSSLSSILVAGFFLLAFNANSHAHFAWLSVVDYSPDPGASLEAYIGWGHRYPLEGFLEKDALEEIQLYKPSGGESNLQFVSDMEVNSTAGLSEKGAYLLSARRKAGFYTKTAQGGKRSSKKGLKHVIKCSYSSMCMKAVVNVGQGANAEQGAFDRVVGHPIEIVPLENPGGLKTGDYLPMKVLFKGKPFKGDVFATYAGFSNDKNTYAYATTSDAKGLARIKVLQAGTWLIKVAHQLPYSDPEVCDAESYVGALTFEVP